jgi:predicted RNA-binding protein associated with RNAse of E/G family
LKTLDLQRKNTEFRQATVEDGFDRAYHVMEMYDVSGQLIGLHGDVGSPAEIRDSTIWFTDYELDVIWKPNGEVQIEDQAEFIKAVAAYGYSPEFQERCWRGAEQLRRILADWAPSFLRDTHGVSLAEEPK